MELVCLDLEGVLVPEIWIAVAEKTRIDDLRLTTRDISDYDELMNHRLRILEKKGIHLGEIQDIIGTLEPLEGALNFTRRLRRETQLVILSDTFQQFAAPLMRKLEYPTLFCNTLDVSQNDKIVGYRLRQDDGKKKAVEGFQAMGFKVFAAGDSYNDVTMLKAADRGMFFRTPDSIRGEFPEFHAAENHNELLAGIRSFLTAPPAATG